MRTRLLLPLLILALAWGQELIDQLLFAGQWNLPMGPDQPWWGVITAPFSHAGFGHLISNSLAFLPLSWLVLSRGMRDYLSVWMSVLLINIPVALFWPARSHGLSGVVYGLLGYLLLIGWLERRIISIISGPGGVLALRLSPDRLDPRRFPCRRQLDRPQRRVHRRPWWRLLRCTASPPLIEDS